MNKKELKNIEEQIEGIKQWPNVVDVWIQEDRYVNVLLKDFKVTGEWKHERLQMCFDMHTKSESIGYYNMGHIRVLGSNQYGATVAFGQAYTPYGNSPYNSSSCIDNYYMCFGGGPWTKGYQAAFKAKDLQALVTQTKHFLVQGKEYQYLGKQVFDKGYPKSVELPQDLTKPLPKHLADVISMSTKPLPAQAPVFKVRDKSKLLRELGV